MRVLIITSNPFTKNGITSVINNIVSSIKDNNIQFDLVCPDMPDQSYYKLFQEKNGTIYTINRSAKHPVRYIKQLYKLIRKNQYDIVHAHGNSASLLMEMLSALLGGVKVRVTHSHNTTCSEMLLHKLLSPFFRISYTYALACGQDAGKWLYGKRQFDVIKNGINVQKYEFSLEDREDLRNELKIKQDDFVIGHVGVMNNQKNHLYLLQVFQMISASVPNTKLMLVGDGKNRSMIEQFISEHHLEDRVVIVGNVNNVAPYLSSMDIIVMPSLYEGLPLALIEEQANGLVCLASDTITRESDISGNVKFISLENENEWKQNIILLHNTINIQQRKSCSITAIKKIVESGYSIEDEAERVRKLYYKLCNQAMKR